MSLEAQRREVLVCEDAAGRAPLEEWLDDLAPDARFNIEARIDRLADGNFGDVRPIGGGLSELRLNFGPGFSIYFGQRGLGVHLILGGTKATQAKDIAKAKDFWRNHG